MKKKRKFEVLADEGKSPEMKEQIQEVRGMINIGHIPGERFIMTRGLVYPTIIFTDTKTGRSTEIGLYASSQVAKALTELFTDNNDKDDNKENNPK